MKAEGETGRAEQIKKERPRQHLSPAQVMHNRIMEMQRRALERATKQAVQEQEVSNLKRPVIPASFGSKVPSNIRQRYLNLIIDECLKFCSSEEAAYKKNHVHEKNKQEILTGFQRTMPHSPPLDGNYGAYALDCEMVYTLGGIELARVTVIDMEGKTVFSGLTAADLKDVTTTGTDVQAILLSMFSDKTILIGHSLESDLFALKLIHSTVVDTSVVFPHRLGPPYKRALKNLMLETFQKIIQSDDGGHDSKEDAVACLDLMKWRIKEDSRRENRYS
nr:hypothetical protein BaRGS_024816 [Batillaria attramentaria]